MTNNKLFYLDSNDAKSIGFDVSRDYAFFFLANLPVKSELECRADGRPILWEDEMAKLIRQSESVGFVITDILYYRFLLSISLLFSIGGQPDVLALLMTSAEQIFGTMQREDVWDLLDYPDLVKVESVIDDIITAAKAQNEVVAIPLSLKWRTIRMGLYGGDSDNVLAGFPKSDKLVVPFSLHANKKKLDDIVTSSQTISIVNRASSILSEYSNLDIMDGNEDVFKSIFVFCNSICTIFSALFVDGIVNDEINDAYKRIWTFLLRTKSSCFVPKSAFDKARELLL